MTPNGMDFDFTHLACDEDASRILLLTADNAVSIGDLSKTLDIPMSRCYRRVHDMEGKGMLKIVSMDHNRAAQYKSNLKSFYIILEEENLSFFVEYQDGGTRAFNYDVAPTSRATA